MQRTRATPPPGTMPSSTAAASGVHGVFHTSLLFLQLHFGCRAHLDHRDAADQLGQPLLQLLAVVVRGGVLDLSADLLDAAFDFGSLAAAFDQRGVVLVDGDFLTRPRSSTFTFFELDAEDLP